MLFGNKYQFDLLTYPGKRFGKKFNPSESESFLIILDQSEGKNR